MIRSIESRLMSDYISKKEEPFLDLGCGDGTFAISLDLKNNYGIDFSETAVNKAENYGYYVDVKLANASAIPFKNSFFSTVFSNSAVEHMDALEAVILEVNRVLKKAGKFIFTVPTDNFSKIARKDNILKSIGLADDKAINKYDKIHHHVNMLAPETWKKILEESGFKILKQKKYLPCLIGNFVCRMDMLYTIKNDNTNKLILKLEKDIALSRVYRYVFVTITILGVYLTSIPGHTLL